MRGPGAYALWRNDAAPFGPGRFRVVEQAFWAARDSGPRPHGALRFLSVATQKLTHLITVLNGRFSATLGAATVEIWKRGIVTGRVRSNCRACYNLLVALRLPEFAFICRLPALIE